MKDHPPPKRERRVAFSETVSVGEAGPSLSLASSPPEEEREGLELSPCCASQHCRDASVSVALGQVLSLCLCGTGVTSQYLTESFKVNIPTTQNFINYFFLCLVYGTCLAFRPIERGIVVALKDRGWKYFVAAFLDVEANFLIVLAYQYSNLTSIQLLDCWTIPVVLVLSWWCLGTRYLLSHIVGVLICLLGIGCLIWADSSVGKGLSGGSDRLKGDLLALAGATLYGISNVTEEYLVRSFDRLEYLGMVGLFGSLISAVQLSLLERNQLILVRWSDYRILLLLCGFAAGMFVFYSLVAEVMRRAGATLFNLSILTADFYTLLAGIFLFQYQFHFLYFVSFVVVLIGSVVYQVKATGTRDASREGGGAGAAGQGSRRRAGAPAINRCLPSSPCCPCWERAEAAEGDAGLELSGGPDSATAFLRPDLRPPRLVPTPSHTLS